MYRLVMEHWLLAQIIPWSVLNLHQLITFEAFRKRKRLLWPRMKPRWSNSSQRIDDRFVSGNETAVLVTWLTLSAAETRAVCDQDPSHLAHVSQAVSVPAVATTSDKDPAQRLQSVGAVASDLQANSTCCHPKVSASVESRGRERHQSEYMATI